MPFSKLKQHVWINPGHGRHDRLPAEVKLFPLKKHRDPRGYFMEVMRQSVFQELGFVPLQISVSETEIGVVKAFHFHERQSDLFCPLAGKFRIVLLDIRPQSDFQGHGYSILSEPEKPFVLHIPPGVAHGYEVVGEGPGLMLYMMNREYDPSDERRFSWDDAAVGFPWKEAFERGTGE